VHTPSLFRGPKSAQRRLIRSMKGQDGFPPPIQNELAKIYCAYFLADRIKIAAGQRPKYACCAQRSQFAAVDEGSVLCEVNTVMGVYTHDPAEYNGRLLWFSQFEPDQFVYERGESKRVP